MRRHPLQRYWIWLVVLLVVAATLLPGIVSSQEEVASAIRRYKERESSTGYYEEYEFKPLQRAASGGRPGVEPGPFPLQPHGS